MQLVVLEMARERERGRDGLAGARGKLSIVVWLFRRKCCLLHALISVCV